MKYCKSSIQKDGQQVCHKETITITKDEYALISSYLSIPELQSEDKTFTKTVKFPDGMEMDIKCCGAKDVASWTEAVLFYPNGSQACCSDPDAEFVGTWELECNGKLYKAVVNVEP